jgi:prepilin-type N-terminal cleavage/methylation domain-containing protein
VLSPRRHRAHDEAGFTLVELMIAMVITSVVMASLAGLLTSQSKAERRLSILTDNQEAARLALVELQQDLRSAEPLVALDTSTDYASHVRLLHLDFTTGTKTLFQWRLDPITHDLVREVLDDTGAVTATTYRLGGVVDTQPFHYFEQGGVELSPTSANPSVIAECTIRIRITLHAAPGKGPAPTLAESDVELRNRLPGSLYCGQTA